MLIQSPQPLDRRWLPVFNTEDEDVPPGGLMFIDDIVDGVAQITKPTENGQIGGLLVNGYITIPKQQLGSGYLDYPAIAAYQGGTPAPADIWGTRADSWFLRSGVEGFFILGGASPDEGSSSGLVNVVPVSSGATQVKHGYLDNTLYAGFSATMSVWEYTLGAETETTEDIVVRDWLLIAGQSIDADTKVIAVLDKDSGYWYVVAAECDGTGPPTFTSIVLGATEVVGGADGELLVAGTGGVAQSSSLADLLTALGGVSATFG